jgi:iron complex outermembrane receptor protein
MKSLTYKTLLVLAILLSQLTGLHAQTAKQNAKITGKLLNEQGKAVDYATVSLLKAKDSSIVKGALSNDNGIYTFERIAAGSYVVKATMVGYDKAVSGTFVLDEGATITVPVIKMQAGNHNLKAVNIVAVKPLIERKIDRTVMNVENSVLAAGNSAMEILEKAPGVTVDKDDNISLKGKQGVTVMLDGKLTYLSSAQLASMLRSTDGNTIQSIEIITNPSAKFDAAGNSGIINIKMKKNRASGTNGSVTLGAGYGDRHKANSSLNLNHKQGKLNLFGNYSYYNNERPRIMDINRLVTENSINTFYDQSTSMISKRQNHSYKIGADYETSKKNVLGVQVSGFNVASNDNNFTNTLIRPNPDQLNSRTTTIAGVNDHMNNITANLNDRYTIDSLGKELSFDLDYSHFNNNKNSDYNSNYYRPNGNVLATPSFSSNTLPANISIQSAKLDYTHPFSKTVKLETGLKASFVATDNDLRSDSVKNGNRVQDLSRTNRFRYHEHINAAYVNLSKSWKKTSLQIGFRAEQTNSETNSLDSTGVASIGNRHYLNLFPSVFANHDFSDKHSLGFSYSRRIDRPDYEDLNSFAYFLDRYTFQQGNPFLKPQYTNSYELTYTYKKSVSATLGYSKTTDVITEVIITNGQLTYDTKENLSIQNSYNLNFNIPFTFAKWWNSNTNATGFYLGFKSALAQSYLNDGQYAMQLNSTHTFTIAKTLRAEGTFNYQSGLTYGIFHIRSNYSFDAGVSKSFYNKKANLKLSVSDVFNTRKQYLNTLYSNTNLTIAQKNETQVARLTFTYNFGSSKFSARQRRTGAEEEKSRVKSGN